MKKLHASIYKSFIGPFLISFTVILFILVLQFLSKYIDELFGKNIEKAVLGQVFFYASCTMVTLALPLGILLSSLLTMGNMGERYELAAMKSAGIGLFKTMVPMLKFTFVVAMISMTFSFFLIPSANLKLYSLIYDMSKVKPSFQLKEGHFYDGVDQYVIHVAEIDRERDMLYKIKVYDHSGESGNLRITLADSGKMFPNKAGTVLVLNLFKGVTHEDQPKETEEEKVYNYRRFYFDTLVYEIGMSGFNFEKSNEETFKPHQYMKNIFELKHTVDSIGGNLDSITLELKRYVTKYSKVYEDSVPVYTCYSQMKEKDFVAEQFPIENQEAIQTQAILNARAIKNYAHIMAERLGRESEKHRKYQIEFQFRFALPIACLVFLFLGAPLGAIIRKGGVGIPVIVSILFFILFYVFMLQGRKFALDQIVPLWVGVWLPIIVMGPFAILFTYQSATDSPMFISSAWFSLLYKLRDVTIGRIPYFKRKKIRGHDSYTRVTQEFWDEWEQSNREKENGKSKTVDDSDGPGVA